MKRIIINIPREEDAELVLEALKRFENISVIDPLQLHEVIPLDPEGALN